MTDQRSDEQQNEEPGKHSERGQWLQTIKAYALRHWRGENSLVYAFWVNQIVAMIVVNSVYGMLAYIFLKLGYAGLAPFAAAYLSVIAFYVWSIVGTWRSTSASIRHVRGVRFPFWSYAARVWLAIPVLFLATHVFRPF